MFYLSTAQSIFTRIYFWLVEQTTYTYVQNQEIQEDSTKCIIYHLLIEPFLGENTNQSNISHLSTFHTIP